MQNKLLKIARMGFALAVLSFGALPALGQDDPRKLCLEMAEGNEKFEKEDIEEAIKMIGSDIKNGLDVNKRTPDGLTPLHWAACTKIEIVSILLQAGAQVNARDKEFGQTPLHWAASFSTDPEVITALIVARADVYAQDKHGKTPLHWAAQRNKNPEMIMILLKAGAIGGLVDGEGKTAFDYAEENKALQDTEAYWALSDARF